MVIHGTVDPLNRPYIRVEAPGNHSVLLIVDTGFNRPLLVNRHIMYRLGLENCTIDTDVGPERMELGDYSQSEALVGLVRIIWFGQERLVDCLVTTQIPQRPPREDEPVGLLGTELLLDCQLSIDFPARSLKIQRSA